VLVPVKLGMRVEAEQRLASSNRALQAADSVDTSTWNGARGLMGPAEKGSRFRGFHHAKDDERGLAACTQAFYDGSSSLDVDGQYCSSTFPAFASAVAMRREVAINDQQRTEEWFLNSRSSPEPLPNDGSEGVAAINQGVMADRNQDYPLAIRHYQKGLSLLAAASNGEEDPLKSFRTKARLRPFFDRLHLLGTTPVHQVAKTITKDAFELSKLDCEDKVRAAGLATGRYPRHISQPYARASQGTLEDAATREAAMYLEHEKYKQFLAECYDQPIAPKSGRSGANAFHHGRHVHSNAPHLMQPKNVPKPIGHVQAWEDWVGDAKIIPDLHHRESDVNCVVEHLDSVASCRQEVEMMWSSALANAERRQ